ARAEIAARSLVTVVGDDEIALRPRLHGPVAGRREIQPRPRRVGVGHPDGIAATHPALVGDRIFGIALRIVLARERLAVDAEAERRPVDVELDRVPGRGEDPAETHRGRGPDEAVTLALDLFPVLF